MVIEHLEKLPNDLGARYAKLKEDQSFRDSTFSGTSDVAVLKGRFEIASRHLIAK
jgi:hypothetical protein